MSLAKLLPALLPAALLLGQTSVNAADLDGAKLFKDKTCWSCHGKDAKTPIIPTYPKIAGQNADYALQQMQDIKSGARSNGQSVAMKAVMYLVSDEEMKAIASWLATLDSSGTGAAAAAPAAKVAAPVAAAAATAAANPHAAGDKPEGWNDNFADKDSEQFQAMNLPADKENGIEVYEVCSACHLLEGWGMPDGTFPQLAGQHRSVLVKQLADIRALNRDNPTMYPFAKEESIGGVQAMADVTDYIEKLPMNPDNGVGAGDNLALGEKLYKDNCVKCHGDNGQGDPVKYYPRIHGQHYNYMLRQFEWIRDGKRRNANPDMVKQIKGFSDADMKAVIDYTARLKPSKEMLAPSKDWQNPDYD